MPDVIVIDVVRCYSFGVDDVVWSCSLGVVIIVDVLLTIVERMNTAHTLSVQEILKYYKSNEDIGLSDEEVRIAQEKYGPNGEFALFLLEILRYCLIITGFQSLFVFFMIWKIFTAWSFALN